jgi:hypothetical protein
MIPFKFFNGKIYTDEYTVPTPPYGISNRHWNILPQDLRRGEINHMVIYLRGWEACRFNDTTNPFRDIERREVWDRGFIDYRNRITYDNNR